MTKKSTKKPAASKTTKPTTAAAKETSPKQGAKHSPPTESAPDANTSQPVNEVEVKQATQGKEKKLSAIDAAAKLLSETKEPLNCKQMIEGIAAKGYWTSPGGKTPHATLYSAIIREIKEKGDEARFTKTERGQFAASAK